MMKSRSDVIMVDVREESEWSAGHIHGAVHLGKGVIERDIEKAIPDVDTVLVLSFQISDAIRSSFFRGIAKPRSFSMSPSSLWDRSSYRI